MSYERLKYIMNTINSNTNKMVYKPATVSTKMKVRDREFRELYNSGKTYRNIQNFINVLNNAFN
jgi:hypothetical protein